MTRATAHLPTRRGSLPLVVDSLMSALFLGMIVAAVVVRVRQKRKDRKVPVLERRDDGPQLY